MTPSCSWPAIRAETPVRPLVPATRHGTSVTQQRRYLPLGKDARRAVSHTFRSHRPSDRDDSSLALKRHLSRPTIQAPFRRENNRREMEQLHQSAATAGTVTTQKIRQHSQVVGGGGREEGEHTKSHTTRARRCERGLREVSSMVVWLTMGSRKTHHREHDKSRRSEEEEGEKPRPSRKSLLEERKAAAAGAKEEEERERGGEMGGQLLLRDRRVPLCRGGGGGGEVLSLIRAGCRGQWPGIPPRCL